MKKIVTAINVLEAKLQRLLNSKKPYILSPPLSYNIRIKLRKINSDIEDLDRAIIILKGWNI